MKKTVLITTLYSSMLVAEVGSLYVETGPSLLSHAKNDNGIKSDLDSHAFKWTLGSILTEQKNYSVSIEGSVMLGVDGKSKGSVEQNNGNILTNAKLYVDKLYNVNLKGTFPLTNELKVNGYLGVSKAKVIANADNYTNSNDFQNSITYGAGLSYAFHPEVYVYSNYMQYFSNLSAFEMGLGFRF